MLGPAGPRPAAVSALSESEREQALQVLTGDRFVDKSVAQAWATLLDMTGTAPDRMAPSRRKAGDGEQVEGEAGEEAAVEGPESAGHVVAGDVAEEDVHPALVSDSGGEQ
jgi:hypothetical protein